MSKSNIIQAWEFLNKPVGQIASEPGASDTLEASFGGSPQATEVFVLIATGNQAALLKEFLSKARVKAAAEVG